MCQIPKENNQNMNFLMFNHFQLGDEIADNIIQAAKDLDYNG